MFKFKLIYFSTAVYPGQGEIINVAHYYPLITTPGQN